MSEESESQGHILVIDDEPLMLSLIRRILIMEGFTVSLASDGVYGVSLVRDEKPDLILLDIMMPGLDGFTTLERIREISNAPVIMVTAMRDEESLQKTMDIGADDYITKPFRPEEMVARVKAKLRRV